MKKASEAVHVSRKFRCAFCDKIRKGAYRWVDGLRSCEKCNREYDCARPPVKVQCPLCKGAGELTEV